MNPTSLASLRTHRCLLVFTSLTAAVSLGMLIGWGPLTPPSGAVTGTAKPLSEVEPRIAVNLANTPGDNDATPSSFKITQPGSYYLTGNITGVAGRHGIEIASHGVTLDLNGFDLSGIAGMGAFSGVYVSVINAINVTVFNGSVRNWGGQGVDMQTFNTVNGRIERMRAFGNISTGLSITGGGAIIGCSAYHNGGSGIIGGNYGLITDCVSGDNSVHGVTTGVGGVVSNCVVSTNLGSGINVSSGTLVTGCTAQSNTLDGVVCGTGCTLSGNRCSGNGSSGDGAGIHATGTDNRIEANNCTGADRGIDVDILGNIIIRNSCSGNTVNWDVVASNIILVVQGAAAPAVTGSTGGPAPGSTDPNANFTY